MHDKPERPKREHKGKIAVAESDMRWCSDGFEFGCDNGEKLRVTFALDCCDREAIDWAASTGATVLSQAENREDLVIYGWSSGHHCPLLFESELESNNFFLVSFVFGSDVFHADINTTVFLVDGDAIRGWFYIHSRQQTIIFRAVDTNRTPY